MLNGQSIVIKGDISGSEDLVIAGRVEGSIALDGRVLTLAPGSHVVGTVSAAAVIVSGTVEGSIDATEAAATVDVRPMAPVASWDDVTRYQAARGHLSAAREARAAAMRRLRESLRPSEDRWFVTRTWWFAGLALFVFGAEWLLRRLAGAR